MAGVKELLEIIFAFCLVLSPIILSLVAVTIVEIFTRK